VRRRGREGKFFKYSLRSITGVGEERRKEHTDLNASANGMFSVAAKERAILWVKTLGQSWDVAK